VQTETVHLRHQATGRTAQCGPYRAYDTATTVESAAELRDCVADHQQQGFIEVPGS
jgi:hypothetical protein